MSADHNMLMTSIEDDASSGSGDDVNIIDGHKKRQSVAPSSGRCKRSRKATGDAIIEAMLEIGTASKMRAAAITKKEDQFSISKCIKVLDDMQDTSSSMDDFDTELDEMELVAAASGYYYYNILNRLPPRNLSPKTHGFMDELLNGDDDTCREILRMDKHVFHKLCDTLRQRNMLRDTAGVMIEEQLAIFLNIVGQNERNRVIQERFQHSGETISRHFKNVLRAIKSLSREFLHLLPLESPQEILKSKRFFPHFKNCIGVIDGMHIPANVPTKDQPRFRNRKGDPSQNVLAACTFDLQFIFVYPGWEGSAADARVLRAVLDDPDQNFPRAPQDKYYIVDSGYPNADGFIAPYQGVRHRLNEFRGAGQMPRNAKELFNHRHASLRLAMRKSFTALKARFPILKLAPQYAFDIQRDVVIAACVIHNHIRREGRDDWLFENVGGNLLGELLEGDDDGPPEVLQVEEDQIASALRDSVAGGMWNEFVTSWDEW